MEEIKIATVFSGIGAPEQALKRLKLKHKIVFACDIDNFCKQSYFANYDIQEDQWYTDIHSIETEKYKDKVDLLVGGSPCQAFSIIGKRGGLEDIRGTLIFSYIDLINKIQPKVFVFENVRGLLSHNKKKTWEIVYNEFKKTGYDLHYQLMVAKDYGIPQKRKRLFMVGFKEPRPDFQFPEPIELKYRVQDLLVDRADEKCYLNPPKDNSEPRPVEDRYFITEKQKKYIMAGGTKKYYQKPETDLDIARPLITQPKSRAGISNYYTIGGRIRMLIPREYLRLMGFGDDFKIVVSETQAYKQAGNSMVVDVLMHLFQAIYKK